MSENIAEALAMVQRLMTPKRGGMKFGEPLIDGYEADEAFYGMYNDPNRFIITDPAQCWTCGVYLKADRTCPVCDAPKDAGSVMSDERFHKRMVRIIHEASLRMVMERINRDCLRWM